MKLLIKYIIKLLKKKRKVSPIIEPETDIIEPETDIIEPKPDGSVSELDILESEQEEDEESEADLQKQNMQVLNNETCSVCCELLETDIVRILACGHYYHEKCIEQWFYIVNTCPECRESFDTISYPFS